MLRLDGFDQLLKRRLSLEMCFVVNQKRILTQESREQWARLAMAGQATIISRATAATKHRVCRGTIYAMSRRVIGLVEPADQLRIDIVRLLDAHAV